MVVPIRRQVAFILGVLGLWGCGTGGDATADGTQSQPEEMQVEILISTADGGLGERIEFPGVTGVDQLAVDLARRRVYFTRPDAAELIRVSWGPSS